MRRIAVINQKGGVGKTTITTNLGHALALKGYRVTVIDLDPQGQLAASLGMFRPPVEGVDQVLLNGAELESAVINTRDLLQLVSAGNNLQQVEELRGGEPPGQVFLRMRWKVSSVIKTLSCSTVHHRREFLSRMPCLLLMRF
jgi:chromosome partitioning protein